MNEAAVVLYALTAVVSGSLAWNSFKHRFLPVSRPMGSVASLIAVVSCLNCIQLFGLELSQWQRQALSDIDNVLMMLLFPIWIWLLLEYHLEKKLGLFDPRILIFLIHPLVQFLIMGVDISSNGFLSSTSALAIVSLEERLGDYMTVRQVYSTVLAFLLTCLTPYVMLKKQQHTRSNLIQAVIVTVLPFISLILYRHGYIEIRLVEIFLTIYLLWISRQYRLLDVMPVALRGVVDKVDSGILVSNMKAKLLFVNDYANHLLDLNLSREELKQRKQEIPECIKKHFDFTSPDKQEAQIELFDKKEKKHYIDAILQPIFHPKTKKQLGATLSLHDVTQRKKTELKLQSFDRQKSEFFAGISHEFRTPLTLSLGNLDDVLEEAEHIKPDELKASLRRVKSNNQRLLTLVNQLLELSRLEAGSMKIQPKLLHLDSYLSPLIANFESQASKQNCKIHLHFDHDTAQESTIYFDADAFDKIVLNLVSNALKSMPAGGEVTVQLDSSNDTYLELSVTDTGCGIPADALSKVFEMFYSHQSDNSAWPQGAGVGLSLVKQLLMQHGADIKVESVEGLGTTFTVILRKGYAHFPKTVLIDHQTQPLDTSKHVEAVISGESGLENIPIDLVDNASVLAEHKRDNQYKPSEKLVLLVEDNAEMRLYIRKHLAKHFRLIEAADGEEGLALALQTTPDLVLSDVMMPKMNGYDLCKELKSNPQTSHIPVLLLTAKSSQTEKLEGLELGADDYLSKPFDVKELTLRMSNLIQSRLIIQEQYQSKGLQKVICNPALPKRESSFLDTLQKYVQENISNVDIQVSDLAEAVNMSERSLNRKLKALTGDTPKKMLLVIRLEYAKKILSSNPGEPITQIAYQVGFADASHFTRSFKSHYSMTPTQYKARI